MYLDVVDGHGCFGRLRFVFKLIFHLVEGLTKEFLGKDGLDVSDHWILALLIQFLL